MRGKGAAQTLFTWVLASRPLAVFHFFFRSATIGPKYGEPVAGSLLPLGASRRSNEVAESGGWRCLVSTPRHLLESLIVFHAEHPAEALVPCLLGHIRLARLGAVPRLMPRLAAVVALSGFHGNARLSALLG